MADTAPSPKPFKLPEDVTTLSQMRDQLSDYLNTLERNTDAINLWLQKNQAQLIVGHHQLMRAVKYKKDEPEALKVLSSFGDAAGFVLSIDDFGKLSDASFGANSALSQAIRKAQVGVPPKILEDLPDITLPDADAPKPVVAAPPPPPQPEPEKETEKKKWWQVGSWFRKDEKSTEPDPAEIEAEIRRREDELRRHWRLVRGELIALQSDRHYYVDSFMNWVGETLAPEANKPTPNLDKLMETYQNPQYVIDLARHDYDLVINVKAQALREKALAYSKTAILIDEQRIPEFAALLPSLFPKPETTDAKQLKEFLLKDFDAVSFADLALNRVTSRANQLLLLETALKYEPDFKVSGLKTKREIFERVMQETTAPNDPLNSRALKIALDALRTGKKDEDLAELIGLKGTAMTPFDRLVLRFKGGVAAMKAAIGELLDGLSDNNGKSEENLTGFMEAVARQDVPALSGILDRMAQAQSGHQFMALWELSHSQATAPLVDQILATASTKSDLANLMDKALAAGILDELKVHSNAVRGASQNVLNFLDKQVLAEPGAFSLPVTRRLIASSFANGGLDELRAELTKQGGWLERVAISKLPPDGKLNWIAALVEPFSSDAARANILYAAATAPGANADAAKTLSAMEANYAGDNVRLSDGKIMTNLGRIANIWYNAETKAMRYTVNGTGQTFMESLSPAEAGEVLSLLQRKGGFQSEYDGIYRPENIDRIATDANGTKITWNRHTGELNVDAAARDALHAREDFVHVTGKNGALLSINQRSVALLQPLSDGTHLLVDRYGAVQILDGTVQVAAKEPLLDLSGTFVNPKNASILQLNADKNSLEFRCESNDFEDLLESAVPGQYFYPVELASKSDFAKLEQAVASSDMIQAPGGKSLQNLHFNFAQLGYMMYTDARETGFTCRKYGPTRKPGFISAEEDLAKNIFQGLSSKSGLIAAENVITHKSCIDDAYYNPDRELLCLLIGNDILQIPCDEKTGYNILKKLAAEDGFTVVGANYTAKGQEVPADVVQMSRATMLFYSPAQEKTLVVADDRSFPISLDQDQANELFDIVEKDGLKNAKAATRAEAVWTQGLKDALQALPPEFVKVTPSLTDLSREYLLKQVVGEQTESRPMPDPQADFSIVAARLKANDNFTYPAGKVKAPAMKPRR